MNSVPPRIAGSRPAAINALVAAVAGGFALAAAAAVVYFFNPSAYGFYPVCQFHQLTGWNCPGCGGTRALYALLHGHFAAALRDNAMLVLGLAAGAVRAGWFGLNWLRGRPNGRFLPSRLLLPFVAVLIVFGVLRNLPAFAFLSP